MISVLLVGLLIGMKHALEADHIAAVASLATRSRSLMETMRVGVAWGLGHTLTLVLCGSLVLVLQTVVPERLAQILEFAVGVMLVILGADVLRRVLKERIHFHVHQHVGGIRHFHAHGHADQALLGRSGFGQSGHDPARHDHSHPRGFPLRALLVGLMHGMAGSAALVLLTVETLRSFPLGLAYIAVFSLGSIAGMALLSVVIALPLRLSSRYLTWSYNGLSAGVGLLTLLLGMVVMYRIGVMEGL
jgi:hypothetical protein